MIRYRIVVLRQLALLSRESNGNVRDSAHHIFISDGVLRDSAIGRIDHLRRQQVRAPIINLDVRLFKFVSALERWEVFRMTYTVCLVVEL